MELEGARESLRELMTDEQLLTWAAGFGVDLTDRDELVDSLAVGFAVALWRNTVLEDVHAPDIGQWLSATGRPPLGEDAEPPATLLAEFQRAKNRAWAEDLAPGQWDWTSAENEESADEARLDLVVSHAETGFGIPDDVMLRANASTAADARDLLEEGLPAAVTGRDDQDLGPCEVEDMPQVLWDVLDFFSDPDREVCVGDAVCAAEDLIGSENWSDYVTQVSEKFSRIAVFFPLLGVRRTLWYVAVSGASYAGEWYPCPQWARAVKRAEEVARTAPGEFWFSAPEDFTEEAAEDFWGSVLRPEYLTGQQASWVLRSRLSEQVREVRREDATRLGQPVPTFHPLFALF